MPALTFKHSRLAATLMLSAAAAMLAPLSAGAQSANKDAHTVSGRALVTPEKSGGNKMSVNDRKLMRELAQSHLAEIKMSALATELSTNPAVRSYAVDMLEAHHKALDELRQLADKGGAILPGGVEAEQAALLTRMALQTGDAFDQLYTEQAGIAAHQQAQQLFQEASSRAEAPALKEYAAQLVPVINKHLKMAQQLKDNQAKVASTQGEGKQPAAPGK